MTIKYEEVYLRVIFQASARASLARYIDGYNASCFSTLSSEPGPETPHEAHFQCAVINPDGSLTEAGTQPNAQTPDNRATYQFISIPIMNSPSPQYFDPDVDQRVRQNIMFRLSARIDSPRK